MAEPVLSTVKVVIEADTGDSESRIKRLNSELKKLDKGGTTTGKSGAQIRETGDASKKAVDKVKGLSGALGNLGRAFGRIMMYRAIRSAIKAITEAFSYGMKNAYAFSASIETTGHRFAAAMDGMSASSSIMKNQLGSAFISLLAAIAPIVNAIIGLITRLAVALSQLFAAFTGGTWLRATNSAEDLAGACGGGAAAAKEWKNQLLGFDEINRLEDPGDTGGGGGGGGAGLADMFEEAELTGIFAKIHEKIQELKEELDFAPLLESWNTLKEAAQGLADVIMKGLGWAWENVMKPLAHWTIEKAIPAIINLIAAAFDFLGAALEFCAPFFKELWDDFLQPIAEWVGDTFISALQTITDLLRDLADLLSGEMTFREFLDQLTPMETLLLAVGTAFGVVATAIGIFNGVTAAMTAIFGAAAAVIGFITSPIGLVIVAITALITAGILLYQHWDEIKAKAIEVWNSIVAKWNEAKENLSNSWNEFKTNAKQSFEETWENIKRPFVEATDAIKAKWDEFTGWIEGKWDAFKTWWEGLSLGSFHIPLPHLSITGSFSIMPPSVPSFSIDWYAKGGFPEDGLFMANHGELVGKFSNGRTAVANNEQIIAGIQRGVYEAVSAAMANSDSRGGGSIIMNVNGREFMRAVYEDGRAVSNEHGVSLITA